MSDEKLDRDLETEVDQEAEATKVAEAPETTAVAETPAEQTVTAGAPRVSPAPATTQSEDGQKDAAAKRNRMVAAVACCLVALAALVGGVGYVSGAFGGAEQASKTAAAQKTDGASGEKAEQSQDGEKAKADDAVSADTVAAADQPAEQQQDQTVQTDSSASIDNGGASSGGGDSSSGDTSSYSGTGEVIEEDSDPQPEPTPAPTPTPEPTPTPTPQPATITVYVSIDSSRANHYDSSWPTSMGSGTVTLSEGSSVYDALCALGVSVGGDSGYVSAINGLPHKACGAMSGWTYNVDGVYSNKACGKYILSGGETVCWVYSTDAEPTISM